MLSDLVRPFSYLTIKHNSFLPALVNWALPLAVATALTGAIAIFGISVDVFGTNGAVARLLGFLQSLPGFYIAALSAIATFNNPDMVKVMPGTPPTGIVTHNGGTQRVPLTRRRFLSSMFAYLTILSIGLTFAAMLMLALAEPIKGILPDIMRGPAKFFGWFVFCLFIMQMSTITLWGLFYLGDRIHTPDPASPPAP